MAAYQYHLSVVPKAGIKMKHEFIPESIGVSTEKGVFESDAKIYWKEAKKTVDDIISKIDLIVKRAEWGNDKTSFNWKTYTEYVDNDASIYLNENNMTIREFSFRVDLREKNLIFLKNMIELGKENDWLFMDRKGKLMKPDYTEIRESILTSNAYSFLKDPIKFFENLDNQKK